MFKGISRPSAVLSPGVLNELELGRGVLWVLGRGVVFELLPGVQVLLEGVNVLLEGVNVLLVRVNVLLTVLKVELMTSTPEQLEVRVRFKP